jgi:hypothetical protein
VCCLTAGVFPLWLAVTLHEGSTLLVALNSLRLLVEPREPAQQLPLVQEAAADSAGRTGLAAAQQGAEGAGGEGQQGQAIGAVNAQLLVPLFSK